MTIRLHLFRDCMKSPLAPASGERGRGEGASASQDVRVIREVSSETQADLKCTPWNHSPPLPNPLPRGGGEGTVSFAALRLIGFLCAVWSTCAATACADSPRRNVVILYADDWRHD